VFHVYCSSGIRSNTSTKLCHTNGRGQNDGVTAWSSVITAVNTTKTNGATNMVAIAISPACLATDSRNRRRRTSRAIGRRSISAATAYAAAEATRPPCVGRPTTAIGTHLPDSAPTAVTRG
jgi:hypothetical protein